MNRQHSSPTPASRYPGAFPESRGQRALRVLVVDDDEDSAEACACLLASMGCMVATARNGEEGLAAALSFRPDVAIIDLEMPRLPGDDAARLIRGQHWGQGIVLISVSGLDLSVALRRSHEAGFDNHLMKPMDLRWLEAQITHWQRRHTGD